MHIEIEFVLTPDDVAELTIAYQKVAAKIISPMRLWAMRIVPLVVVGFVGIGIFVTWSNANQPSVDARDRVPNMILGFLPCILIALFIPAVVFRKRLRRAFFQHFAKRKFTGSPNMSQPQQVTILENMIRIKSSTASAEFAWTHFIHFAETENLFLLFASSRLAQVLPKRGFRSVDDLNAFRAFAQAHVGNQPIGFPVQPAAGATPVEERAR